MCPAENPIQLFLYFSQLTLSRKTLLTRQPSFSFGAREDFLIELAFWALDKPQTILVEHSPSVWCPHEKIKSKRNTITIRINKRLIN